MHKDHFDREVERKLDHGLPIITTPHAAADLTSKGSISGRDAPAAQDSCSSRNVQRLGVAREIARLCAAAQLIATVQCSDCRHFLSLVAGTDGLIRCFSRQHCHDDQMVSARPRIFSRRSTPRSA